MSEVGALRVQKTILLSPELSYCSYTWELGLSVNCSWITNKFVFSGSCGLVWPGACHGMRCKSNGKKN